MFPTFQAIKDYQLIGIISAMVGVIAGIILIWEIVSPQVIETVMNEVRNFSSFLQQTNTLVLRTAVAFLSQLAPIALMKI